MTNELLVGPETPIAARTQDTYITSKVKARLIEAKKFDANNVKVVTERARRLPHGSSCRPPKATRPPRSPRRLRTSCAWSSSSSTRVEPPMTAGGHDTRAALPAKIATPADALARIGWLPRPLVFTNGVFDVLHRGHVTYLDQARALGAALVVAVNSDASVRRLSKGRTPPSESARRTGWRVLRALAAVDLVVPVRFRHAARSHRRVPARRPREGRRLHRGHHRRRVRSHRRRRQDSSRFRSPPAHSTSALIARIRGSSAAGPPAGARPLGERRAAPDLGGLHASARPGRRPRRSPLGERRTAPIGGSR